MAYNVLTQVNSHIGFFSKILIQVALHFDFLDHGNLNCQIVPFPLTRPRQFYYMQHDIFIIYTMSNLLFRNMTNLLNLACHFYFLTHLGKLFYAYYFLHFYRHIILCLLKSTKLLFCTISCHDVKLTHILPLTSVFQHHGCFFGVHHANL